MLNEASVFHHFKFSIKIYAAHSQNLYMKCYMYRKYSGLVKFK